MTPRYFNRATRNHARQHVVASDCFDRFMDSRQRRSARHGSSPSLLFGCGLGEFAEIERRSLAEAFAPGRS